MFATGITKRTPTCCSLSVSSKAIILILLWTVFVGALNNMIVCIAIVQSLTFVTQLYNYTEPFLPFVIFYSSDALITMFYPLNGFVADMFLGRFRTIMTSLTLLLCSFVFCLVCFFINHILSPSNVCVVVLNVVGTFLW